MRRCKIRFVLPGWADIDIPVNAEPAEDLLHSLAKGRAPTWLENLIMESINIEDIEIEEVRYITEPDPEEELNFDME